MKKAYTYIHQHFASICLTVVLVALFLPVSAGATAAATSACAVDVTASSALGHSNVSTITSSDEIVDIPCLLEKINRVLNTVVPFLVGIAVFIIIWHVFKYIMSAGDEEKRTEARMFVVWGVIFVFLMVSVWGFINILVNSFSLSKQAPSQRPTLPTIPVPPAR